MEKKPLAIVIGRYYTTRLTLIRAAGMVGCDVVVIQTQADQKEIFKVDASSKFVVGCEISNEPNQDDLIGKIRKHAATDRKVILLPADDYAASVIDLHLDILRKDGFLYPHVNNEQGAVTRLMDKGYQKKLAQEAGFKTAKCWTAEYKDGSYHIPDDVIFPCFTKAQDSYTSGGLKHYQKRCNTIDELQHVLGEIAKVSHVSVLLEEYCEIEKEYGVQGVSLKDRIIAPAAIAKNSSRIGITATGSIFSISKIPHLYEKLASFMQKTQFYGIFDIEFFMSKGELYFNELNVRLGANGFALTYGVANVPGVFIRKTLGMPVEDDYTSVVFEDKTFASEQVLLAMCFEDTISYSQYRKTLRDTNILSLTFPDDNQPAEVFSKRYRPLRCRLAFYKLARMLKRILKST